MRIAMCAGVALLVSATAFAQDEVARKQAVEMTARMPLEKSMKGAPYSAESVVESSQTLADGNRISRKTTGAVYRDSEGRTRREEDVTVTTKTPNGPVSALRKTISIVDPVAGFSYSLDPEHKIAWRTAGGLASVVMDKLEATMVEGQMKLELDKKMAEADDRKKAAADERKKGALDEQSGRSSEPARGGVAAGGRGSFAGRAYAIAPDGPLEHKTIEGVAVEGRKTTMVIPAGQIGNEQPITITSEEWRSPDLNLLVLTRHSDPRSGESSYRLINIIRAEPDTSLFMVPADYAVRDTGIRKMLDLERKY
jgi:hypothetical protein